MRLYVAVTDKDWFALHASKPEVDEVNFWRPSSDATFKALQPGDLLLFKLHSQTNNSTASNAASTHYQKFSVSSVVNYFFIGVAVPPGTVPSNFRISPFRPTAQPW